ncbi:beta-N-acetylhexosaminidase [Caldalkalibacillus salinus]|uniref:beta-N-acetylhexosaminidase n=1 Tax=Caldalkalibacillus salinus TaxID=2803787 RepID=UPI001EFFCBA0|nr:beta-N-acetylhexosaminidase [Caldalkalibacillus salinus]
MMKDKEALRRKIGQLMVCGFKAERPEQVSKEMETLITEWYVGGVILFGRNIGTTQDVLKLTTKLQQLAKEAGHERPLLICIDQENGVVRRLGEGTTIFPGAMCLGATNQERYAYEVGKATGIELKALGINWNLAPTVDVNNNPYNPVISVRSYGEDPQSVARFGQATMRGMQEAGVITTLKHFPGHGDTHVDSHLDLPQIDYSLDRLKEVELVPFKQCIQAGADTVMTAHIDFPALEPQGRPATLSQSIVTGLLRETLGFDGVVTTDCMEMKAIADTVGTPQGALQAIQAGVDLVMISHLPTLQKEAIQTIEEALLQGECSQARIDEAYRRVKRLKETYLSWEDITDTFTLSVPSTVGCQDHEVLAHDVYEQGVTLVKGEHHLPLNPSSEVTGYRTLVVYPENSYLTWVEDERFSNHTLGAEVQRVDPQASVHILSAEPTLLEIEDVLDEAAHYDTVIVGTLTAGQRSSQAELVQKLCQLDNVQVAVMAMRSPYDLAHFPNVDIYIATYEFTNPALRVATDILYGRKKAKGTMPVTIPKF